MQSWILTLEAAAHVGANAKVDMKAIMNRLTKMVFCLPANMFFPNLSPNRFWNPFRSETN
jgi:hypothetical protein